MSFVSRFATKMLLKAQRVLKAYAPQPYWWMPLEAAGIISSAGYTYDIGNIRKGNFNSIDYYVANADKVTDSPYPSRITHLSFSGDGYASWERGAVTSAGYPLSVSLWFKPTLSSFTKDSALVSAALFYAINSGLNKNWFIALGASGRLEIGLCDNTDRSADLSVRRIQYNNGNPTGAVKDNEWNHIAVTITSISDTSLWLNGEALVSTGHIWGTDSQGTPISSNPTPHLGTFFHGVLADFMFFDRALDDGEMASLYSSAPSINYKQLMHIQRPKIAWHLEKDPAEPNPYPAVIEDWSNLSNELLWLTDNGALPVVSDSSLPSMSSYVDTSSVGQLRIDNGGNIFAPTEGWLMAIVRLDATPVAENVLYSNANPDAGSHAWFKFGVGANGKLFARLQSEYTGHSYHVESTDTVPVGEDIYIAHGKTSAGWLFYIGGIGLSATVEVATEGWRIDSTKWIREMSSGNNQRIFIGGIGEYGDMYNRWQGRVYSVAGTELTGVSEEIHDQLAMAALTQEIDYR